MYFECTVNGVDWAALPATAIGGGTAVLLTSAGGLWRANVSGLALVRCRLANVFGAVLVIGLGTEAAL